MEEKSKDLLKIISENFPEFIINDNDYINIERKYDHGGFAQIDLVQNIHNKKKYAFKQFIIDTTRDPNQYKHILSEISTMAKIQHPFLLKIHGFSTRKLCVLSEYMENGSLFNYLKKYKKTSSCLTGTQKTKIAMGIADAMTYLHKLNIIHRDLKTQNILLDSNLLPRVADFGAVIDDSELKTNHLATVHYTCPERLCDDPYGLPADVYSYAIILYEMLSNKFPWSEIPEKGFPHMKLIIEAVKKGQRPKLPDNAPNGIISLINQCWAQDPNDRPTFSSIYKTFVKHEAFYEGTDINEINDLNEYLHPSISHRRLTSNPAVSIISKRKKEPIVITDRRLSTPNKHMKKIELINIPLDSRTTPHESSNSSEQLGISPSQNEYKILSNTIKSSKAGVYLDLSRLDDPSSHDFFITLRIASKQLLRKQTHQFFSVLNKFFKPSMDETIMHSILTNINPILERSNTAINGFIENGMHYKLPLNESQNLFMDSVQIISTLFIKAPQIFDDYNYVIQDIIQKNTKIGLFLINTYSKAFLSVNNPYQILNLLESQKDVFFNSEVAAKYIEFLLYLCQTFKDYKLHNFPFCIRVFFSGLQHKEKEVIIISYRSLKLLYEKQYHSLLDDNFDTIRKHIRDPNLRKEVFDFIVSKLGDNENCLGLLFSINMKNNETKQIIFPKQSDMLIKITNFPNDLEECSSVLKLLIKLSKKNENVNSFLNLKQWISIPLPEYTQTGKLLIEFLDSHEEIKIILLNSQEIFILLMNLSQSCEIDFLSCFWSITEQLISKNNPGIMNKFLQTLSDNNTLSNFIENAFKTHDKSIDIALSFITCFAKFGCPKEFLNLHKQLKSLLKEEKFVKNAIIAISELTIYPEFAQFFHVEKLEKYFQKVVQNDECSIYARKILQNLKICNFK